MTIFVNWKAKDLQEGMENMMSGAKADYEEFFTARGKKRSYLPLMLTLN